LTNGTTTRVSLLIRIRDAEDDDAWTQFSQVYGPLLYRYARKHSLQDADAADLTQEVLREVAKAIGDFEYNPQIGKFRSWLFTVARYMLNRIRTRTNRQPAATGDSLVREALADAPAASLEDSAFWEEEYEQRLFEWAAEEICGQFQESTWLAFWKTAVDGKKPKDVAHELSLSVGSVYVAKNRVLARLKEKINEVDDQ